MFELSSHNAQLTSYNPRREKHGTEGKAAGDLHFKCNMESGALSMFHATLRSMLFHKNSEATGGDLADQVHEAPNLRFPLLGTIHWKKEYVGYSLRLHIGINQRSHVVIDDCQINDFKITPMEGGTCIVMFRVQFYPDEKTGGKLTMLLADSTVDISVTPPEGGEAAATPPPKDRGTTATLQ